MKFNVVIPSHDPHLQCFREVALSVEYALCELGHEVTFTSGEPMSPGRPIYFGLPLGKLPDDAIIYNGEQVSPSSIWTARRLDLTYKNHVVWDYSPVNAARYPSYGLPTPAVVRPGYAPRLENSFTHDTKTHDVVFFGSHNQRRGRLLRGIMDAGLKLLSVPFGVYGSERDKFIAKARLCLNVHFYENAIFESVRCSYLIHNHVPILSETDGEDSYKLWGVEGAPYVDLVERAVSLLGEPAERALAETEAVQYAALRQIPIKDEVGAALEQLDRKPALISLPVQIKAPAPQAPGASPELTLCMIVKDERDVIERCLGSVKPYIKQWSIVDTGSTDGTQEIIKTFMADMPGKLHERPWKEYDGSRTEAIELAQAVCQARGWLLLIDADEIFTMEGALEIPEQYDGYNAWITRCMGCKPWGRTTFLRASKPWFYQLPRHEGLYCRIPAPNRIEPIAGALILSTSDGARSKENAYERYLEDARVLENWLKNNPHHPERGRAQYYIAQSYRDAATGREPTDRPAMQRAVAAYMKRSTMGGYDQEVHSSYLWAADCMKKLDYPWEQIQQRFLEAFNQRPQRAEGLFNVGEHYRKLGQYPLAELFLRQAAALPLPGDIFPDLDRAIYEWKAKEEWGVALSWLGRWAEARELFREVLKRDLLDHDRARIEQNFQESLKRAPE